MNAEMCKSFFVMKNERKKEEKDNAEALRTLRSAE